MVSGSDCGHVFVWDSDTGELANFFRAETRGAVNCVQGHPLGHPVLITSGMSPQLSVWTATATVNTTCEGAEELMEENKRNRLRGRSRIQITPQILLEFLTHHMHNNGLGPGNRPVAVRADRPGGGDNDAAQLQRAMLIHELLGRLRAEDVAE